MQVNRLVRQKDRGNKEHVGAEEQRRKQRGKWLLFVLRPSNMLVYLRDRPAQTSVQVVTFLLVSQTPHWPYRAVPLRYWQSDNRTSTAVLPHLRATQKGNLARPNSRSLQAVRKPEGPAMHCHLHRGDWSFHLMNEKKKKRTSLLQLLELVEED